MEIRCGPMKRRDKGGGFDEEARDTENDEKVSERVVTGREKYTEFRSRTEQVDFNLCVSASSASLISQNCRPR